MDADIEELERLEALASSIDESESEGESSAEGETVDEGGVSTKLPVLEEGLAAAGKDGTLVRSSTNSKSTELSELILSVDRVHNYSLTVASEEEGDEDSNNSEEETEDFGDDGQELMERIGSVSPFHESEHGMSPEPAAAYSDQDSDAESEDDQVTTEENIETCNQNYKVGS